MVTVIDALPPGLTVSVEGSIEVMEMLWAYATVYVPDNKRIKERAVLSLFIWQDLLRKYRMLSQDPFRFGTEVDTPTRSVGMYRNMGEMCCWKCEFPHYFPLDYRKSVNNLHRPTSIKSIGIRLLS